MKEKETKRKTCSICNAKIWFQTETIYQFLEHYMSFDVFSVETNLDGFVKRLVDESNLYLQ